MAGPLILEALRKDWIGREPQNHPTFTVSADIVHLQEVTSPCGSPIWQDVSLFLFLRRLGQPVTVLLVGIT